MYQFMIGFVVAILIAGVAGTVFLRKKLSRLKKQQTNDLEKFEQLSKLTGGLAHEIKNPLSTIKVNLKLAAEDLERNDHDLKRVLKKISVIEKETDRLSHILTDFLKYIGKPELQMIAADINEIVSDIIDFFSPQAHKHAITMRIGLSEEPLICKVDCGLLKQVLLNLFLNAQQAMTTGGELIIRTAMQDDHVLIQISDTGPGMEPKQLERIFEAYYSSKLGGSGLGLPTTKKIVAAHKGTITVDSEVGKGTSFTIKLPSSGKTS